MRMVWPISCPHASQGTLGDCDSGARLGLISFIVFIVLAGRLRQGDIVSIRGWLSDLQKLWTWRHGLAEAQKV